MIYRNMKDTDIYGVYEVEVSAFSEPWSYNALRDELKNKLDLVRMEKRDLMVQ